MDDDIADVEAYLAGLDDAPRATLERLRTTLRSIVPHADECVRYGMPALALHGKAIAGYAAFRDHCGYFPMSGSVIERAGEAVAGFTVSKGGLQFPIGGTVPTKLLRTLVKLRLAELSEVRNGTRRDYHADGALSAVGPMKDGLLHGKWTWYRADGGLLRTGQFRAGEPVGAWTTYDADGTAVKTTDRTPKR
ncbi:MAG: hypothetical protein KDB40_18535 [Acidimicrobiales bacterium]|nr:hypothetical protein [Acidimicrobiales bacterium]